MSDVTRRALQRLQAQATYETLAAADDALRRACEADDIWDFITEFERDALERAGRILATARGEMLELTRPRTGEPDVTG
jgi:hypothetical protein